MNYRNLESTEATIKSYREAFNKMLEYCSNVVPSCNESNHRTVLPTCWRPAHATKYDAEKLRKDANYLSVTFAPLIEYGKPRYLKEGYWDYDSFFKVSWQLRIPFEIYVWENARTEYPDGFDEDGNPIGGAKYTPPQMKAWCSPQYLCLGEISGFPMKSWSLPEWRDKQDEIITFMDDNPKLRDEYHKKVEQANQHYHEWLTELNKVANLTNDFVGLIPL